MWIIICVHKVIWQTEINGHIFTICVYHPYTKQRRTSWHGNTGSNDGEFYTEITLLYSAKKETHMWFNRNFFRYGVYMTETTIYDWNQQFVRNQNLFVNLLLCETGVCSGPLSATRSITCVATSCFLHCSASAWHGWNQTCNLCMWDVIPGLLDSQTQLWEGLRRWVTWPYASINKVPQMLDRGQVGGICWPGQYLDSISSQKVLCEAGRVRASIILLKR